MRLKRLELFGFKSFADRTVLEFPHAVTGVVGPNGCGKSNVVDAIRWVLGETRPTSMRGGEMTDVIFKGSTSRPALGLAEVTLVLDNTCQSIPAHGAEVAVTRRVFRSGEGEYEIDGSKVRLKDVKDLLFDTGLGSRGYSVLEQGRIDAVLSANPLDRRTIFEEAAGVSRFRQRRKETEARLKRVDQDLERIDDVVGELETRVRSLKLQAGKARSYVELRDAWRLKGVGLAQNQVHRLDRALTAAAAELAELDRRVAQLREGRGAAEAEVEQREGDQRQRVQAVDGAGAEVSRLGGELLTLEERARQLLSRVEGWRQQAEAEGQRVLQLEERLGERRGELAAGEADRERLRSEAERAEAALEQLGGVYREASRRYREARQQSEEQSKRTNGLIHEKAASFNAARQLEHSLVPLTQRAERAEGRLAELRERVHGARREWAVAEDGRAAAEVERDARQGAYDLAQAELTAAREEEGRARDGRRRVEVERAALQSRVEALLDWERERETLDAGSRSLLEEPAGPNAPPLPASQLRGLLADHVRCRPEFARALDAALGAAAQAVVLDDPRQAGAIGEWLKRERIGQARLVVPGGLNRGTCEPLLPDVPLDLRGQVRGLLIEHLEVATDLVPVVHLLLCDCVLVSDLEAALDLTEELPGWRLVTPEGDLVDASGVLTGHREVGQGAVGRRAVAAELRIDLERLELALQADAAAEQGAIERRAALEAEVLAAAGRLDAARSALAEAVVRVRTGESRVGDAERSLTVAERESAGLIEERRAAETRLQVLRREHEAAERAFALENARLEELERARHEIEGQRDESGREEQRARIELTRVREQAQGLERRLSDLARGATELQLEIERARRLSGENSEQAQRGAAEGEQIATARAALQAEREGAQAELERCRAAEREGREAIALLRRSVDEVTRELEQVLGQRGERQLQQQRAELERGEVLRRAEEDFELDHETLLRLFDPRTDTLDEEALAALEAEVQELARKLDRLGPVNLDAVTELEGVAQRLEFLTGQRADLVESKGQLQKALDTINSESERLFLETFDTVREHFRAIFRQLFGGGKADIELLPDAPPLEAGIEITARPPGRETLPIGLLSGGQRTMTALALLFAVFRSRPSPFCVLDEVDAALDDANVGRFLGMLDGFVAESQFVIVTHNKGTMNACDMLYGITMETKGVSHNVSVELSQVDAFVPEVTGNVELAAATRSEVRTFELGEPDGEEPTVELTPKGSGGARPARAERGAMPVE